MVQKQNNRDTEYRDRENTEPSSQTENINSRNNNTNMDEPSAAEADVERANNAGIGDSGWDDAKLTNYTSNHSSDA